MDISTVLVLFHLITRLSILGLLSGTLACRLVLSILLKPGYALLLSPLCYALLAYTLD